MERILSSASKRLFNLIHQNNLVYNSCWEDPRLDREAMKLGADDRVLVITSAGCNALEYLLDEPAHVYAVDMNPRQNALLQLKMAAIRNLEYSDFFQLFGKGQFPGFRELYHDVLRKDLPDFAQKVWDKRWGYFHSRRFRKSLYFRGTSGLVATALSVHIQLRKLYDDLLAIFDANSLEEQKQLYFEKIERKFWSPGLRWIVRGDFAMALLGVPRAQRRLIELTYKGGMTRFIMDSIETVFTQLPLGDNYFWWLYVTGSYSEKRCPEYLKEENFKKLKSGLLNRISTHNSSILNFLENHPEPISRFVLLDHMDWLAENHRDILERQWQAILNRSAKNTRILYRSGGPSVDFVDPIQVRWNGQKQALGGILQRQQTLADELHKRDRVHTYGSFYIDDLKVA